MFDYISSTAAFHFIWSFTIVNEAGIIKMSPSFNSECSPTQKLTSIMTTKHILYLNFAMTISSLLINFWRDNLIIYCATEEWFLKKWIYTGKYSNQTVNIRITNLIACIKSWFWHTRKGLSFIHRWQWQLWEEKHLKKKKKDLVKTVFRRSTPIFTQKFIPSTSANTVIHGH